jgi:fatty-acyl-CoA synthase
VLLTDDILASAAGSVPHRVAMTLGDDELTFSELQLQSFRVANALIGIGVGRGDRIIYWADISLAAAPLQFALGRLGAAFAPLNPAFSDEETASAINYLNPRLVIADGCHADRAGAVVESLGVPLATTGSHGPGLDLDALVAAASTSPPATQAHEDDIFAIFLTSGSTGQPKGVMISQRATWLRAYAGSQVTCTAGGGGQLVTFPLFHMAGWTFSYYAWSAHQPAHLVPRADGAEILDAVGTHRPANLYCIPAVWHRIFDEQKAQSVESVEWALIGTSRVDPELLSLIKERFPGSRTTVSYGSTEVCRALSLADRDLFRKPGSVGQTVPGVQTRISAAGELEVRSHMMMTGYYALPDETAVALEDGWYHTGDLVEQDAEGYVTVVGRSQEVIRSGGEWVSPLEVEQALSDFPGVVDVAVTGISDARWGEVVCAAVVMVDGRNPPTVEEVRRHLGPRLASYKHPRYVSVVQSIPRTAATGQIQRALLAAKEFAS